jgi:serine/threonine protein kinase
MLTSCPFCGFDFAAPEGRTGVTAVCPRCRRSFNAYAQGDTLELLPGGRVAAVVGPRSPVGSAVGRQFHEYRIVEEIGRGGMGVVYRAIQETLDRPVALKVILTGPNAGEEDVKRFLREAASAARLRHPNIVTVHELDVHEGIYYYTMDFIEGRNLAQMIGPGGMEPGRAARLAARVALALEHAHRRGIVHRDLKPGNIIVQADGEPVITDFGLACDLRRREEETCETAGTPAYMSPEQVLGLPMATEPATDIWSLGALFYEMLTGRPPFSGGTRELFEAIASQSAPPALQLRPELPPELSSAAMKCLEKNPDDRFPSAAALAERLWQWLEAAPGRTGA